MNSKQYRLESTRGVTATLSSKKFYVVHLVANCDGWRRGERQPKLGVRTYIVLLVRILC